MVPYVAYPWFAPISVTTGNFDSNGAGIPSGPYENIYFCNGNFPGVPDLRGVVLAGVITGMGGSTLLPEVNPALSTLNPNYTLGMRDGTNYVALQVSEIPEHTHTATVVIDDPGHDHKYTFTRVDSGSDDTAEGVRPTNIPNTLTSTEFTNLKGTAAGNDQNVFVINSLTGQNGAHKNNQPTIGCYYIMYIP
jgi:microcystin-dependent protein